MRFASAALPQVTSTTHLSVKKSPGLVTLSHARNFLRVSRLRDRLQYLPGDEKFYSENGDRDQNGNRAKGESMIKFKGITEISPSVAAAYVRQHGRQVLGLALFALLVHDVFGPHGFIAMRRTQKEIEQIREQIGKMNDENKSLAEQVTSLKSDPKAIERIAREEMGLARPGEMIFKIPETPKSPSK
jgi:cell division protein FtsB